MRNLEVNAHLRALNATPSHLITPAIFIIQLVLFTEISIKVWFDVTLGNITEIKMIVYKELSSLERDLNIPLKTLYGISNNLGRHYREKKLPKKDGTFRTLSVPDEALKKIQRAIAEKLLAYEPVSVYAKAYKYGASVKTNAALHVNKEKLLKLDIYRFFDSISYSAVKEKAFPSNKYSEQIRVLLSMLCYRGEVLPQGAPTSPIISNIIMRDFDTELGAWCKDRGITYTRYCDDMTFSGAFDASEILHYVSEKLKQNGFILNGKKTHLLKEGTRKTVTGIVVNQKLNTKKDYRRQIRQEIYFCKKFGIEEHLRRISYAGNISGYLLKLLGKVNFVLQITPENKEFSDYKKLLLKLINENK